MENPESDQQVGTSVFVAKFFSGDELSSLFLPYGLLCDRSSDIPLETGDRLELDDVKLKEVTEVIFKDCLQFIRGEVSDTDTFEWYHDFIAFTNLQIVVRHNAAILVEGEDLDDLLDYTIIHMRNLRSSVARNALMFVSCLIESITDNHDLFLSISLKLMPQLFRCCTSEKIVYRRPALDNLVAISRRCGRKDYIYIAWLIMTYACDRNAKVSSAAGVTLQAFFDHFSDDYLAQVDKAITTEWLGPCLSSKDVTVKEICTKVVTRIIGLISPEEVESWYYSIDPKSKVAKLLRPHVKIKETVQDLNSPEDELNGATLPSAIVCSTGEMPSNMEVVDCGSTEMIHSESGEQVDSIASSGDINAVDEVEL
ncbi:hypothetical protein BBOV_I003990 [Babesia bovis T2Bo]|uniref:Uncharacterized protein n=1 Tax=Babesia bovis TaxID=5865 RepID=A7AWQ2_BABBO|nr:hypothetical protein BBOV_I003990 [Babesia bovis T2Bo]EDO05480.1 hypothetical protein BBOV_I003990 [Babesia bovis T2Bo]|eukprot:XP_001609048.1 hypothetical protein [Babesia bovis T2Bo]